MIGIGVGVVADVVDVVVDDCGTMLDEESDRFQFLTADRIANLRPPYTHRTHTQAHAHAHAHTHAYIHTHARQREKERQGGREADTCTYKRHNTTRTIHTKCCEIYTLYSIEMRKQYLDSNEVNKTGELVPTKCKNSKHTNVLTMH